MLPSAVLELPGQTRSLAAGVGGVGALRRDLEEEGRDLRGAGSGEQGGAEGSARESLCFDRPLDESLNAPCHTPRGAA